MIKVHQESFAFFAATAILTVPVAAVAPTELRAQTAPAPVCLAKTPASAVPLTVMVAPERQGALEAAGFSVQACGGKEAAAFQYRSDICALSSGMPQPAQPTLQTESEGSFS